MVFLFNKYAYWVIISTFTGSLTLFAVYVKMNVESVTYMVLQTFFLNLKILLFKKTFIYFVMMKVYNILWLKMCLRRLF